jgi:hypothetical protein
MDGSSFVTLACEQFGHLSIGSGIQMRLLILGDSWSLGKMIVAQARAQGIDAALCNSGRNRARIRC